MDDIHFEQLLHIGWGDQAVEDNVWGAVLLDQTLPDGKVVGRP